MRRHRSAQSFSGALNFLIVKEMAGFDGCQGPTAGVEFCGECDQLKNSCQAETGNAGIYQIIHLGAVHGKQQAHQNQRHGQPGANVGNGNDGGTNLNGYILHSMLHRVPGLVAGYANGGCGGIAEYVVRQANHVVPGIIVVCEVAGHTFDPDLLQAIGYRTTVSPHGGDSGIDITAYKDELPPRILVQVKSQDGDIKETTIQSLKGAMREGDYGLFVTLSNYTKNAKKYLESTPIIRGINGTELVELVLKYYGQLSEKYRKMIPLKMVYIPVTLDTDSN